jgi:hypothetical protein
MTILCLIIFIFGLQIKSFCSGLASPDHSLRSNARVVSFVELGRSFHKNMSAYQSLEIGVMSFTGFKF